MRASSMFLAAVSIVCPSAAALAGTVGLVGLGDLPGGDRSSTAYGVNANGSVVVGYGISAAGAQGFRWTASTGLVPLSYLPQGDRSGARGVSGNGSFTVGDATAGSGFGSVKVAGWNATGSVTDLGISGNAWGVSADGSVVVGTSGLQAFRWTSAQGQVNLGYLPGATNPGNGTPSSSALGVSADGNVVVGYGSSPAGYQAFRWTADAGMVGLGDLTTNGLVNSTAWAASADGVVVVGRATGQGFRWTESTGMVGLGYVPGTTYSNEAYDVSADGSTIVGYSYNGGTDDSTADHDAIVWTQDLGMRKLWDVLLAQGIDPAASGWDNLNEALAISDDGTTVVGAGYRHGYYEAFVATLRGDRGASIDGGGGAIIAVPLPAAIWPAGALMFGMVGRRVLRRREV